MAPDTGLLACFSKKYKLQFSLVCLLKTLLAFAGGHFALLSPESLSPVLLEGRDSAALLFDLGRANPRSAAALRRGSAALLGGLHRPQVGA